MNKKIKKILNKKNKSKVICLTAYSKSVASILDKHCDLVLVGDSLGSVLYNFNSTKEVTLNTMINHSKSVRLGVKKSLMVVDMPYNTYRNSKEALNSAIKVMKESGGHSVKLEGGAEIIESVQRILTAGIPVMGHLGLTPQSIYKFGTYTVRAKEEEEANKLIEDAKLLEATGCFALVLEKVPAELAQKVAETISIPVIGIGAGSGVDGQVLVTHDLLGMTHEFSPRFLRRYLSLFDEITGAIKEYVQDVKSVDFPNEKEQY